MSITQLDVAREAGVSRALVSLVMRNSPQVSAAKRDAVLAAASALGYRPNSHAAQLASHRTNVLGVVVTEMANPLFAEVMFEVERSSRSRGYDIVPVLGDVDVDRERVAIERLLNQRVDGIHLGGTRLPTDEILALAEQVPLVITGRTLEGVDSVAVDGRMGASLVVDHLVELGHRSIAHIDGGMSAGARSRRGGYVGAMNSHGLGKEVRVVDGGPSEQHGVEAAELLLAGRNPPTAIFAFNDIAALGVLSVARSRGLSVPGNLAVVGFDDMPASGLAYVDLTTVRQPRELLGDTSVDLLIDRITDPERTTESLLLPPKLVSRSTSGRMIAPTP